VHTLPSMNHMVCIVRVQAIIVSVSCVHVCAHFISLF
jgi:hypothetical protein